MDAQEPASQEATRILGQLASGSSEGAERLLELVYAELRRMAADYLGRERAGHTLQPTALVHAAYLRLIDQREVEWQGRGHFLALASQAMRRILVDHARTKQRQKRGQGWARVALDLDTGAALAAEGDPDDLVALDGVLERLREVSPRATKIVELRFFGGLPNEAVAEALDVSRSTVDREWRFARAWLSRELKRGTP